MFGGEQDKYVSDEEGEQNETDRSGCDIYFLNRTPSPLRNISNTDDLRAHFALKPNGYTPLARVLKTVLNDNATPCKTERKLLIIIATDGKNGYFLSKCDSLNKVK